MLRGTERTEIYGPGETSPVTVHLARLRSCAGVRVYTSYSLELAPGAEQPNGWPRGQTGSFPCYIESASHNAPREKRDKNNCTYKGLEQSPIAKVSIPKPRWKPNLPFHQRRMDFCELKAKHWGSRRVTMTGLGAVLRHPAHQDRLLSIKLELLHPIWCPNVAGVEWSSAAAITYGAIKLTIYGRGIEWPIGTSVSEMKVPYGKPRVYWERINPKPTECQLGYEESDPVFNPSGVPYSH